MTVFRTSLVVVIACIIGSTIPAEHAPPLSVHVAYP